MRHKEGMWDLLSLMAAAKGKEQGTSIDLTFLVQVVKFGSPILPSPQTLPASIPVHSVRERNGRRVKNVPQVTEIGELSVCRRDERSPGVLRI